jgi:hypothetical protein
VKIRSQDWRLDADIPPQVLDYRLGNRSALGWIRD